MFDRRYPGDPKIPLRGVYLTEMSALAYAHQRTWARPFRVALFLIAEN